jgi:hypothetical protein
VELGWLWGTLAGTGLAFIGVMAQRSAKSYADEAVKPVQKEVTDLKLELANSNFVRADGELMKELRRDSKKLLRLFHALNVALARKLNLDLIEVREDDEP